MKIDPGNKPFSDTLNGNQPIPTPTSVLFTYQATCHPPRPKISTQEVRTQPTAADPFADLKTAFEPQREKLKTFNLKQIVTRRPEKPKGKTQKS